MLTCCVTAPWLSLPNNGRTMGRRTHLTPGRDSPDHPCVIFARRHPRNARGGISALLVIALLLFAHTCALHGTACATPTGTSLESHSVTHDHDGDCGDHDGCEQGTHDDCSTGSICCSTWAPPTATVSVPAPEAISLGLAVSGPLFEPVRLFASQLVPIPPESPPPLISILRL